MENSKLVFGLFVMALVVALVACNKSDDITRSDSIKDNEIIIENAVDDPNTSTESAGARAPYGIKITFGIHTYNPLDEPCLGSGICGITFGAAAEGDVQADLAFDGNGNLVIDFGYDVNHPQLEGDVFIMDGEYRIPEELAAELGGESYVIAPGAYPFMPTTQRKVVVFTK